MLKFIDAEPVHAELLRNTLIASKGYWGYSPEQLEQWRDNLKFEEAYIVANRVILIFNALEFVGFFALVKGEVNELDHLWLLPHAIGKGYGNLAFEQIKLECEKLGITEFYIIADPDAEGFYLKKGAFKVGEVYSEPQKRMLPKLKYRLIGAVQF